MSRRFELTVSDELWERIEEARGYERRASFVKRAIEAALNEPPLRSREDLERLRKVWDSPALERQFTEENPFSREALEERFAPGRPPVSRADMFRAATERKK